MIQRAASTSGACRGEGDSRFGGEKEQGRGEKGVEDAGIENAEGVCGIKTEGEAKERQMEAVEWRELNTERGGKEKKGEEGKNIYSSNEKLSCSFSVHHSQSKCDVTPINFAFNLWHIIKREEG